MEDIVRNLIFRDNLESLKCTYSHMEGVDRVTADIEEMKVKAEEKNLEVDDFFAQIDDQDKTSNPLKKKQKPLIVLDAQNVAMRHGKDQVFSCKGIQIAIQFWKKNGHEVICFLPEYLFNYKEVSQKKKQLQLDLN